MSHIERPTSCPPEGQVEAFDAGWNAHEIGLRRDTVDTFAHSSGKAWALLAWDIRNNIAQRQAREERRTTNMMQVKRNSWHFRLWRFGRSASDPRPKNLCKYFWHIALVKVLLPLVLAVGFLVGVGAVLWLIWGHPAETAGIVSMFAGGIFLAFAMLKVVEKIGERREMKRLNEQMFPTPPKPKKEPGIIRAFLRARKQKMCPLIEVVDD